MAAQVPFLEVIADKLIVSAVVGIVGGILLWPFRKVKKEWAEAKSELATLKNELQVQRTNHLTHIENNTQETVSVLREVSKTLTDMHLDQRMLMGRLEK